MHIEKYVFSLKYAGRLVGLFALSLSCLPFSFAASGYAAQIDGLGAVAVNVT